MKKGIRCLRALAGIVALGVLIAFFTGNETGRGLLEKAAGSFSSREGLYEISDATDFSGDHPVLAGDVSRFCPGEGIESLDFSVGACQLTTAVSGDDNFYIEAENAGKLQAYVEDGVLYLVATASSRSMEESGNSQITVFVPEGFTFAQVKLELGAGSLVADSLRGSEIYLSAGAGQLKAGEVSAREFEAVVGAGGMELGQITAEHFTAKVGMGELDAAGEITGSGKIECTLGAVSLLLAGAQEDYDWEISGTAGKITVGTESYSGASQTREVQNGAGRLIALNGSMGNITVQFSGD